MLAAASLSNAAVAEPKVVESVASLRKALTAAKTGDEIVLAAGRYQLRGPLQIPNGVTLCGAGVAETIIESSADWDPGVETLPRKDDPEAYLFSLRKGSDVVICDMTLRGPTLHGAVYAANSKNIELANLKLDTFRWSGVRTHVIDNLRVHDCEFVDAGGKQKHTGGSLYLHFVKNSEFWDNRIRKTDNHPNNVFGIKGYKATNCRIHHNTIDVGFSIEFPFENDRGNEIDHNALASTISIPKYAGGPVWPDGDLSFHIHHNWIRKSYALEWARNCVEIDHNLFDIATDDDGGNLITDHGRVPASGPTLFHNNLIRNPGRGIFWSKGGYSGLTFRHNHVIANTPTRSEGLFGFGGETDFSTITIADNIIECSSENSRPLLRGDAAYAATIQNNRLVNVVDADELSNEATGSKQGLTEPLDFRCGVSGEIHVRGWSVTTPDSE